MENKQLKQLIRLLETLVSETNSAPAKKVRAKSSPLAASVSSTAAAKPKSSAKSSAKPKKTEAEKAAFKEQYTAFVSQAIDFSYYQPLYQAAPESDWELLSAGDPKYPLVISTFKNSAGVRLYECSIPKWNVIFYTFHAPFSLCKFIKAQIDNPVSIPFADEEPTLPAKKSTKKATK